MVDEIKVVRVTNQDELDAALEADPHDDTVIEIHSDPGRFTEHVLVVLDSRGHNIEACDRSRVVAVGTSRLIAGGYSHVDARDAANVDATEYSQVDWRDSSRGKCGYYARGAARDRATVETVSPVPLFALDNSTVTARGDAHVVARGGASVTVRDQATVEMSNDVDVTAYDRAIVRCEGGEVCAHEHVTVYVGKFADRPSVDGVPTVVVHDFKGDTPVMGGAVALRV